MADFTIVSGDSEPSLTDTLTYSNGTAANLEGATLKFVMRSFAMNAPLILTGMPTITKASTGGVAFTFTEQDTVTPGNYMANWQVVFADGAKMTWPTSGYLWIEVEPNLTQGAAQIVSLPEVLDHLNNPPNDRVRDTKLVRNIGAIRPLIENITGPILPQIYDERFDGGNNIIALTHAPSYGYGTSPVLNLIAVSEYRGPIEYPLAIVPSPVYGSIYSVALNARLGSITRRTAGGGVVAFFPGRESTRVIYEAGQSVVPENVKMAALEAIRWWYETTQPVGRGRMTQADAEPAERPMVALPYHCIAMLAPTRKYPSFA
jgi:hypothetical protein